MMSYDYPHPVSRTYQYKKVTKPLLERKRRARINRCLDELKNIMVDALETERENISKLEKADILELTVRHLQRLQASRSSGLSTTSGSEISAESRWQSGFGHCATEACKFLSSLSDEEAAERLARHLTAGLQTGRQTEHSSPRINLLSSTPINCIVNAASCSVVTSEIDTVIRRTSVSSIKSTPRVDQNVDEIRDSGVSKTNASTLMCRASMPLVNDDEKLTANCNGTMKNSRRAVTAAATAKNKTRDQRDVSADDDEEIDVERVDDRDPIWRPW